MTTYPIIKNPEFIDLQKTFVRMTLVSEDGKETVAEFKVPENREPGVNEFWDRIVAEHDVEAMRKKRNDREQLRIQELQRLEKKHKARIENDILRQLFDLKLYYFNLPFVNELTDEEKTSIRRAPNISLLNIAVTYVFNSYMSRTGKKITDIFDEIEDKEFEQLVPTNKNDQKEEEILPDITEDKTANTQLETTESRRKRKSSRYTRNKTANTQLETTESETEQ